MRIIYKPLLTLLPTLLICLLASTVVVGQKKPPTDAAKPQNNPLSEYNKKVYGGVKHILLTSAEKTPEEYYSYKPTETVRSFGQIVGHLADSQYAFCSDVLGEKHTSLKIEQTKTSKAELIAALKAAFAYCDKAYDGLTDAAAAQIVNSDGEERPKLGVMSVNNVHTILHYGNLVTYMRMKNLVPPTSEPGLIENLRKQ